ncbi:hypothetical protein [Streptomyces lavendulae]
MAGLGVLGYEIGDGRADSGGLLRLDGRTAKGQLTVREAWRKQQAAIRLLAAKAGRTPG